MKYFRLIILLLVIATAGWIDPFRDRVAEGNKNYHEKKYEQALQDYNSSSDYAPDDESRASLAFNRGDALFRMGEYDRAIDSFRESLKSGNPEVQKKAFLNMGNAWLKKKKYNEAVEAYINALKIDPDYGRARKNLEYLLKEQEKNREGKDKQKGSDGNRSEEQNQQNKDKGSKKNDEAGKKNSPAGKTGNRAQIKNILESMKNKPVRRQKGKGNDRRYLEKYW